MREELTSCSLCGMEHPAANMTHFDSHNLCPDCLRSHTRICDHCGGRIWLSDDRGEDALTLCAHCAETYYDHCAGCGCFADMDLLHYPADGSGEGYCDDCYNRRRQQERGVQSYCYKPSPVFYGDGPRYLGVELEIDEGGESNSNADQIMAVGDIDFSSEERTQRRGLCRYFPARWQSQRPPRPAKPRQSDLYFQSAR